MDEITFDKMIYAIALGLSEKEQKRPHYTISDKFLFGFDMFAGEAFMHGGKEILKDLHEYTFINHYLTKPVAEWFEGWNSDYIKQIETYSLYNTAALLFRRGEHLALTDACDDLCFNAANDALISREELFIYKLLAQLETSEDYAKVRAFLVEHPQCMDSDIRDLKISFGNNKTVNEIMSAAYEEIPQSSYVCPSCGWTMQFYNLQPSCCNAGCITKALSEKDLRLSGFDRRLRHGVMRYICIPGKLEIDIKNKAEKMGCKTELYPNKDEYDIKITTPTGKVFAIDAKTQKSPYALRDVIMRDEIFTVERIQADECYYVVPHKRLKEYSNYQNICTIEGHPQCITDRYLWKKISDELALDSISQILNIYSEEELIQAAQMLPEDKEYLEKFKKELKN